MESVLIKCGNLTALDFWKAHYLLEHIYKIGRNTRGYIHKCIYNIAT